MSDYFDERLRQANERLNQLYKAAGIEGEIQRAHEGPMFPMHLDDRAPVGSPERKRQLEEERLADAYDVRWGLRKAIFGIADMGRRKQIIEAHRARDRIFREKLVADATNRRRDQEDAEKAATKGNAALIILGLVGAAVGAWTKGALGAWAGLAFGIIFGWAIRDARRKERIASAKQDAELLLEDEAYLSQLDHNGEDFTADQERHREPASGNEPLGYQRKGSEIA